MKGIYLLLGSNIGDRKAILRIARDMIRAEIGETVTCSHIYLTEAWGIRDQPEFLNQVLEVDTGLKPVELLDGILEIQSDMAVKHRIASLFRTTALPDQDFGVSRTR